MINNALILSRLHNCILLWGYNSERIYKLQKKACALLVCKKYNELFKTFQLFKVSGPFVETSCVF